MARISQYEQDGTLNKQDKVLGTDSTTGATKNYTIDSILSFVNTENLVEIFDGAAYTFQSYVDPADDPEGVINLNGGGATDAAFSAINTIFVSIKDGKGQSLAEYFENADNDFIKISKTDNLNQFGIYEVIGIADHGNSKYKRISLTPRGTNGTLTVGQKYFVANYSALYDQDFSDDSVTEFSDVTDAGSGQIITSTERTQLSSLNQNALVHSDVVNNLTSTTTDVPLSANQGKVLKDLIDDINTLLTSDNVELDTLQEIVDYVEANRGTLEGLGISNISGLQNALNGKQNTEAGKGLSTEDFTSAFKSLLEGITAGAEPNVQINWSETNAASDAFIQNKPTDLTNLSLHNVTELNDVTSAGSGAIITTAERNKLNGIAAGAEVNVNADWNATSGDAQILNKPTLAPSNAEANVQANWNETDNTSDAFIQNKPDVSGFVSDTRTITVQGTTNEIEVTPDTAQDLSADRTVTVGLPDDVTVSGDLTVNETIELANTQATTPTFDNGMYVSTEDGHDVLHFRYDGHDLSIDYLTEIVPTGILNGGELGRLATGHSNYSTHFTIAAGDGVINDLNKSAGSDPHPEIKKIAWTTQTIETDGLDSNSNQEKNSWIYIDDTGTVQQKSTAFTEGDWRAYIPLGAIIHSAGVIRLVKTFPRTAYNNMSQLNEFVSMFGPMKKSGHVLSANGTNLILDRSGGVAFALGRNYVTDPENPSTVTDGAQTGVTIHRYYRDGSGGYTRDTNAGAGYTTIDPTKYDDNSGTLATHSSFMFTIQRFYYFPGTPNLVIQYYGRDTYMTMESAERNLPTDPHGEAENTAGQAIYLGAIIVQQNCTDLTNTADAKFFTSGAFRSLVAAPVGALSAAALNDLSDVNVTSPASGQVLKYNSSTQQFENQADAGGIDLTDLSVGTEGTASGNGAIDYDNTTGVFTYTPPAFVDGTGVANKVAVWSDTDTLTNDTNLHWNSTNNYLGVNVSNPQKPLHVDGTIRLTSGAYGDWDLERYYGLACLIAPSATTAFHFGTSANPSVATLTPVHLGKLGVGTTSPDASIDAGDNTDAIIVPKGTDAQRDALTAVSGMLRFNTTDNEFEGYDGTEWGAIGGGGGTGSITTDELTGNGGTTYALSTTPLSEAYTNVYVEGVYQEKSTYSLSGSNIVFGSNVASGLSIEVSTIGSVAANGITNTTFATDTFTANGSTNNFTLVNGSPASKALTMVFIQGVYQAKSKYNLVSGQIQFTGGTPAEDDVIEVISITAVNTANSPVTSVNGQTGVVSISSDVTSVQSKTGAVTLVSTDIPGVVDTSDNTTGLTFWTGTQAEYDALSTYDSNKLYFIT